jgi:hypothetical protein
MPSDTRATLRQLILDHGRTLAADPRRCEAMLRDLCADQRREVNLLINALREQIGADLLTGRSAEPVVMERNRKETGVRPRYCCGERAKGARLDCLWIARGLLLDAVQL